MTPASAFYSRTIARGTVNADDSVARRTAPYSLLNRRDRGAAVPVRGGDESLLIQIMKRIHRVFAKRTTRRFHARGRARRADTRASGGSSSETTSPQREPLRIPRDRDRE